MRRFLRNTAFQLARHDLAMFLEDNEEKILHIFSEEIQLLDDQIPEEQIFIDIKMVPLGKVLLKAVLKAVRRFLTEEPPLN